jgi:hypothetical protein
MELLTLALLFAVCGFLLKTLEQRQRIALLSSRLSAFQIEKLMERLHAGYQRALGESDAERRADVWPQHKGTERELASQFQQVAEKFAQADPNHTRINHNPLPFAHRWLPGLLAPGFDARELLQLHARGIERTVANDDHLLPADRARTLLAELYLMQHSCHWFCRSRTLASARLLARHQTSHSQALQAASPATRQAYQTLTGVSASNP